MTRLSRLLWIAQPCLIAATLWLGLGFPTRDMRVPLVFRNDALFYLAQAKTTLETGWWFHNPALGAPSGHDAVLFPQNASVDQAIVRMVGVVWPDVGAAVTISWIMMIALAGLLAAWGLTQLGASRPTAWVVGALYALTPYALYRNIAHFGLAPYLVPLAATAAIVLATRDDLDWRWRGCYGLLGGLAVIGLNAIYYAAFAIFFLAVGALAGAVRFRRTRPLVAGATALAVVGVAAALNLAPTIVAWQHQRQPEGVHHRVADSELYALKIRQLVTPVPDHWFPPFRAWAARDAAASFPGDTENTGSRLGFIGTLGFLFLLAVLLVPRLAGDGDTGDVMRVAAGLTLAAVLLGTLGGLGSLLSLLVSPAIRAYTRIEPFIAFFALAAVALGIDRWRRRHARTWVAATALVLCVGVADQLVGLTPIVRGTPAVATEYRRLRFFIALLEQRLPADAMVFQLPLRPYPVDGGVARLGTYELFKPYLVSHQLRWSYPVLSDAQVREQTRTGAMAPDALPTYLAGRGFSAILVDRLGYTDNGDAVLDALQRVPERAAPLAQTDRYVALDLRGVTASAH